MSAAVYLQLILITPTHLFFLPFRFTTCPFVILAGIYLYYFSNFTTRRKSFLTHRNSSSPGYIGTHFVAACFLHVRYKHAGGSVVNRFQGFHTCVMMILLAGYLLLVFHMHVDKTLKVLIC